MLPFERGQPPNKQTAGGSNFLHCHSKIHQILSFCALNCGHKSHHIRGRLSIPALCAGGSRGAGRGEGVGFGVAPFVPAVQGKNRDASVLLGIRIIFKDVISLPRYQLKLKSASPAVTELFRGTIR